MNKLFCAAFVLDTIADALESLGKQYCEKYGDMPIVFAGGVMSNKRIKRRLETSFNAVFAEPEYSRDNAVGIAHLAKRRLSFLIS